MKGVGADDGATSSDARSGDEHQRPAEGPRSEHVACKASEHQTSAATETLMIQGPNDSDEGDDSAGSIAGTRGYLMFSRDLGWEAWQLCVFESIVVDQRTREGRLLHAFVSQHLSILPDGSRTGAARSTPPASAHVNSGVDDVPKVGKFFCASRSCLHAPAGVRLLLHIFSKSSKRVTVSTRRTLGGR